MGTLPPTNVLASLGIRSCNDPGNSTSQVGDSSMAVPSSSGKLIIVAEGIPALKKWIVDSIVAGECIDFCKLLPAKGRSSRMPRSVLEGQVILMQTSDYIQSKKLIPDLPTWLQCYAIYMAVVVHHHPERATSMLNYMATIAKLSLKFKWPSWIIYDQTFRQEAAESGSKDWSKIDAGIHAQCFSNMARSVESWCRHCHSLEHLSDSCAFKPTTAPSPASSKKAVYASSVPSFSSKRVCRNYNFHDGECKFGATCKYQHCCSHCYGSHPRPKCTFQKPVSKPKL